MVSENIEGIQPSDSERTIGGTGKLTCIFTSHGAFNEIAWSYTNTKDISQATRVYFYTNDGIGQSAGHLKDRSNHSDTSNSFSLIIYNLQTSDDGTYRCTRASSTVMSANITLQTICKYINYNYVSNLNLSNV